MPKGSSSNANGSGHQGMQSFVKDGGHSSVNRFAASYGEKPTPEGYENAAAIANAMREADACYASAGQSNSNSNGGGYEGGYSNKK